MITQNRTVPMCPYHQTVMTRVVGDVTLKRGMSSWHCPIVEDSFNDILCQYHATKSKVTGLWYLTDKKDREWRRRLHNARRDACRRGIITEGSLKKKMAALLEVPLWMCHVQHFGVIECQRVVAYLARLELIQQD